MDGGVIDADAALGHHLLKVPQAQPIGQVPAHAQQDDRPVELSAFELDHLHLKLLQVPSSV
jgi:hypothetical protein